MKYLGRVMSESWNLTQRVVLTCRGAYHRKSKAQEMANISRHRRCNELPYWDSHANRQPYHLIFSLGHRFHLGLTFVFALGQR